VFVVSAEEEVDFDAILAKGAEAWEKVDNKPVVAGYSVALLVATFFALKFTHLPVIDILIGVPLEVLGIFSAVFLGYRYVKEDGDAYKDVTTFLKKITADLPGFK